MEISLLLDGTLKVLMLTNKKRMEDTIAERMSVLINLVFMELEMAKTHLKILMLFGTMLLSL
jgi:hypothetical protein